jgi:cell division protein ZipA
VDIKDFILIGGGLLIAAVVAHGFWIAWRDRRQELRIDIKPHLIPDDVDDMVRLRGELPNGGSRIIQAPDPEQSSLELDVPPLSLEPLEGPPASDRRASAAEIADPEEVDALLFGARWREEHEASDERPETETAERTEDRSRTEPVLGSADAPAEGRTRSGEAAEGGRARVADVAMPEPIVPDEPKRPRRLKDKRAAERPSTGARRTGDTRTREDEVNPVAAHVPVEELIVLNVLAASGSPYTGDELFAALRTCGLKFGDMNIFHRVEPLTRAVQYSVASAVEPGTFDMAEMEAIRCPGLCMFMQLPGPEDPSAAFEDMLSVARSVTGSLGGEVRDEHRNIMTPQTVEHYRQRIVDFSRRRMSKRA